MARKLTPLQQEYRKEYNRLRKGFSRYKKEGYYFPENVVQKAPKRVTQQMVQNIKNIKPKQLTTVAERVNTETGELIQETKPKSLKKISQTKTKKSKPKQRPKLPQIETPKIETPEISTGDMYNNDSWDFYDDYQTEYYPNMDIIESIKDAIEELPAINEKGLYLAGRKNYLAYFIDDTLSSFFDENELYEYTQYLKENQETIFSQLTRTKYESSEEKLEDEFSHVLKILNYGKTLRPDQQEHISFMQEMM